jgi:hypothetical protein
MTARQQSTDALIWEPLLPPAEILDWFNSRKKPQKLRRLKGISHPIVYRAVFTEFIDENGRHTPCYIGEGGDFRRLSSHFRPDRDQSFRPKMGGGWRVRGHIQNSGGKFRLEILKITRPVNIGGVILSESSFDDPFARRMLENWAILYSRDVEKLRPLNSGLSESAKDLTRKLKSRSAKLKRTGNA